MSETSNVRAEEKHEDGFELDGTFYRWHVTDGGKDLMLIDRFTSMPVHEFFAVIEDEFDRGRAPILLALVATSMRNRHPDWSVDRIERAVLALNLSELQIVGGDVDEVVLPPAEEPASIGESSSSESSSSQTPPASSPSETFSGTPA